MKRLGFATAILLLLLGGKAANAQLVLNLMPDTLSTTPGSTITFLATIQNQSTTDTYFLNDFSWDLNPTNPNVTVDNTSFFGYVPTSLAPGATYGGTTGSNFVDVMVTSAASPNSIISGTFTVYGGTNSSAHNSLAHPSFTINVVPIVTPETSTGLLLGIGGIGGLALAIRRRKPTTVPVSRS